LAQAYELNQKKMNVVLGGTLWLRLGKRNFQTGIDLSGLGLDKIEDNGTEFVIGCMTTLSQLEKNAALNEYGGNAFYEAVRHIVGTQFRNMATVGGSVFGRFGFSDVLTLLLALDTDVNLYKGGRISLAEFVKMKLDNDILTHIIIKKSAAKIAYESLRNSATDFPVLACAVSVKGEKVFASVGARPAKAVRVEMDFCGIEDTAAKITEKITFGSNLRAQREYRRAMCEVLLKRCLIKCVGGGE
jgi:CO/xanthine dehydrogenase FAD-binding subunit